MVSKYLLNTERQGRKRLQIQHGLYVEESKKLLKLAKLQPGMRGLEIGCGAGDMTSVLYEITGEQGHLLSMDISDEQITFCKSKFKKNTGIEFEQMDIMDIDSIGNNFDFVYCRMVLHHIGEANMAIKKMVNCLKSGGVLICEEPSLLDGAYCYPKIKSIDKLKSLLWSLFDGNQKDSDIAYRLRNEMIKNNLDVIHHEVFLPILKTKEERSLYKMGINEIGESLLKSHFLSDEEYQEMCFDFDKLIASDFNVSWLRMHQAIGRKN
jgi:ubiquinone/menaquinone biosynthesis C-methylase UbiE